MCFNPCLLFLFGVDGIPCFAQGHFSEAALQSVVKLTLALQQIPALFCFHSYYLWTEMWKSSSLVRWTTLENEIIICSCGVAAGRGDFCVCCLVKLISKPTSWEEGANCPCVTFKFFFFHAIGESVGTCFRLWHFFFFSLSPFPAEVVCKSTDLNWRRTAIQTGAGRLMKSCPLETNAAESPDADETRDRWVLDLPDIFSYPCPPITP